MIIETFERENHTLVIDRRGPKPKVYRIPKGEPIKPPGIVKKAANFGKAVSSHVRKGRPKATEEQVAERFAICTKCDYLEPTKMQCRKCGCGIKSVVGPFSKLSWADSHCPDKRWHAV